jgi:hypothetical protein
MKTIALILITALTLSNHSFALPSAAPEINASAESARQAADAKAEVQKRGVGEKSRIKVKLRTQGQVKGYISKIEDTSFQITDQKSGRVTTIAYDEVEKLGGPGLSKGAKIAIGVGAAAGAMIVFGLIVWSWHGN